MTVGELCSRMDATEFALWKAWYSIRPFGEEGYYQAIQAAARLKVSLDTLLPEEARETFFMIAGDKEDIKERNKKVGRQLGMLFQLLEKHGNQKKGRNSG